VARGGVGRAVEREPRLLAAGGASAVQRGLLQRVVRSNESGGF
jgi:hypothetical protein